MKNPFRKGIFYYELWILMFVIMWKHDLDYNPILDKRGLTIGRLNIWINKYWFDAVKSRWLFKLRSRFLPILIHKKKLEAIFKSLQFIIEKYPSDPGYFDLYMQSFVIFNTLYSAGMYLHTQEMKNYPYKDITSTIYTIRFREEIIYQAFNRKGTDKFERMIILPHHLRDKKNDSFFKEEFVIHQKYLKKYDLD